MPRFDPVIEVIESLCLRSGDLQMRNKGLFIDCIEDTWNDLNEEVLKIAEIVKMPVRQRFHVNKRTNTIDLPCHANRISSVNVVDHCGIMYPVFRNENLNGQFVDVGSVQDCACEFQCGYKLCNTIKGYEVVRHTETDKNPDGTPVTFSCIDKKVINGGFLYEQKQYPLRQYVSGVWIDTVLHTENVKMCEVEVDRNGCVCDTTANLDNICNSCGISNNNNDQCCIGGTTSIAPNEKCDTWIYYASSRMDWFGIQCGCYPHGSIRGNNIYNIDTTGRRLILPANFGWDHVIVRFYEDITIENLQIPYMAKPTFMAGLQYFATTQNEKKQQLAAVFSQKYSRLKQGLFLDLNKYRLDEIRMMTTPPVFVPSYNTSDYNFRY